MFERDLPKRRIGILCHGGERSFLSMAKSGAKSIFVINTSVWPPWGKLLTVKGILFPFDCSNRSRAHFHYDSLAWNESTAFVFSTREVALSRCFMFRSDEDRRANFGDHVAGQSPPPKCYDALAQSRSGNSNFNQYK